MNIAITQHSIFLTLVQLYFGFTNYTAVWFYTVSTVFPSTSVLKSARLLPLTAHGTLYSAFLDLIGSSQSQTRFMSDEQPMKFLLPFVGGGGSIVCCFVLSFNCSKSSIEVRCLLTDEVPNNKTIKLSKKHSLPRYFLQTKLQFLLQLLKYHSPSTPR